MKQSLCTICNELAEFYCNCSNPIDTICKNHLQVHFQYLREHKISAIEYEVNQFTKQRFISSVINLKQQLNDQKKTLLLNANIFIKNIEKQLQETLKNLEK